MSQTTKETPQDRANDPEALDGASGFSSGYIRIPTSQVIPSTAHLPEDQRELLRWLHSYAMSHRLRWKDVETLTGHDKSFWHKIWTDRYRHHKTGERIDLTSTCDGLAKVKHLVEEREIARTPDFVETSVWRAIATNCRKAFVRQKLVFVFGESQIGKTTCLKQYVLRNNHGQTIYAETPPFGGLTYFAMKLAMALNVSHQKNRHIMIEDVIRSLDSSRLLIIDELHRVFTPTNRKHAVGILDTLRYIHDQSKCGLVLCGTNVFRDSIEEAEFKKFIRQLTLRAVYKLPLPPIPERADLDLVASHYGLAPATGEAEAIMMQLARHSGFGKFCTRLTDGAEMAGKKKQPFTWDHFVRAHYIIRKQEEGK